MFQIVILDSVTSLITPKHLVLIIWIFHWILIVLYWKIVNEQYNKTWYNEKFSAFKISAEKESTIENKSTGSNGNSVVAG